MNNLLPMPERGKDFDASRPPDWQAREQTLDVSRSWIVEAPAGSGKTGLLIQRYLKLLGHESVSDPRQVLAITFTRKATQEMRDRVAEQLMVAAEERPLKDESDFERRSRELARAVVERDARLGWGLVDDPRILRVQTIDSVCAEIARALPVMTGGGGSLMPSEDAGRLYREAARRSLLELGSGDAVLHGSLKMLLLHRDGGLADCERLITEMLARRDQWAEVVPLLEAELTEEHMDSVLLPRLQRTLEIAICTTLTRLREMMPVGVLRDLASLAVDMSDKQPHGRDKLPIAVCASAIGLPGDDANSLEHWKALIHLLVTPSSGNWRSNRGLAKSTMGFEMEAREKARLSAILDALRDDAALLSMLCEVDSLPPAKFPQEQWREVKALFRVLRRAMAELQIVFAERGVCDFSEQTLLAKHALREGGAGEMASTLGMRLEHLLVDEMQDTSTSHYDLIEMLTEGWDGSSQTVFLVGDPKQSIYLFRQARVELFLRTMHAGRIGDMALGRVQLTANFRSQGALVGRFNEDFSLLFPTVAEPEVNQVGFMHADAVRSARPTSPAVNWHAKILPTSSVVEERQAVRRIQRRKDAGAIRDVIERWQTTALPAGREEPWKIAVLVRNREHLREIVRELRGSRTRAAIPFRAVDIEELEERREVLDLYALTRALQHPADRVAWLAVLRAPWCGLELADLHVLSGSDDHLQWRERSVWEAIRLRGDLISADGMARLQRLWPVMHAAETQRGRLTMAQRVERTWKSLGGDLYLDRNELENATRYLQVLDQLEGEDGWVEGGRLMDRLKKLYAETPPKAGAVDLMTIHKAKGLEWDVVIVPGLERRGRANMGRLLTWEEMDSGDDDAAHVVLAPIEGRGEEARELNQWLRGMQRSREAAERKRLLYVACTRAREELHLFAAPQSRMNGTIDPVSDSLLKAAWPFAERQFADLPVAARGWKTQPATPFAVAAEPEGGEGLDLAAVADTPAPAELPRPTMLERLPLSFDPAARFSATKRIAVEVASQPDFERPEGSFAARAFGNAVHGFLELVAKQLAAGLSAETLLGEIVEWGPRIETVLRGDGLPPVMVRREAQRVSTALKNALSDEEGRWVLGTREGAASEYSFTNWEEQRSNFRLDRVFVAGVEPLRSGSDALWIVDYKTGTHGRGVGVEEFVATERLKYGGQMESYARAMQADAGGKELRVGLYYPMLPKLVWWVPEI